MDKASQGLGWRSILIGIFFFISSINGLWPTKSPFFHLSPSTLKIDLLLPSNSIKISDPISKPLNEEIQNT